MRLVHLMTKKIIIARYVKTTGDKYAFSTVTGEMMHIQPTGNSSREIRDGVFGKQFRIYTEGDVDLQPGDRLRNTDTNEYYTVMSDGVSRRTMGSLDFIIAVVQKTKE